MTATMTAVQPRRRAAAAGVLIAVWALAFWMRLQFIHLYGGCSSSYVEWARANYFGGITDFYLNAATALLHGQGYASLAYPPGYPAFLAALARTVSGDVTRMRIAQAALDSTGTWAVYLLVRRLTLSRPWATAGALAYAVFPLWAAGAVFLLAESIAPLLLLWVLVLLLTLSTGASWRAAIPGVAMGVATLVRPDLMLLLIPCAAWLWWSRRSASPPRHMVMLAAGFMIVVGGWGLHNRRAHGIWMIGSTSSGAGLSEGLGELPNDYGYLLDDRVAADRVFETTGHRWASIEANQFFTREYLQAWRDHPAFVMRVIASRVPRILFGSERLQPLFFGRARQALDAFGLLFVLAALWLRRRDAASVLLLALLPLYALASVGMVHYEPRYVRYVELSYLFGVLVVLSSLWHLSRVKWPPIAAVAAALCLLSAVGYTVREARAIAAASNACVNGAATQ